MLQAETELRVQVKVCGGGSWINDLVCGLFDQRADLCSELVAGLLWTMQEAALDEVLAGVSELACVRCGVVHSGPGSVLRRQPLHVDMEGLCQGSRGAT